MAFPKFKFSKIHLPVLAGFVLTLGIALTVVALQQQQDNRSQAATPNICRDGREGRPGGAHCSLWPANNSHFCCSKSCPADSPPLGRDGRCAPDNKYIQCLSEGGKCQTSCSGSLPRADGNKGNKGCDSVAYCCKPRLSACENIGGSCVGKDVTVCPSGKVHDSSISCNSTSKTCCKPNNQPTAPRCGTGSATGGSCFYSGNAGGCPVGRVFVSGTCDSNYYVCCKPDGTQQQNPNPPANPPGGNGGNGGGGQECGSAGCCKAVFGSEAKCQYDNQGLSCPGGYATNYCPLGTHYRCCKPAPQAPKTQLSIPSAFLHIIGKAGDSVLPGAAGGGNEDPEHETRDITINIKDQDGNLKVTDQKATVVYASTSGSFKTSTAIDLGNLPTGSYDITLKMDISLPFTVEDQTLTSGQATDLPTISLVTGDTNNDSKLDILDWNMLLDCFSDIEDAKACSDNTKKLQSDITDDNKVDHPDVNVFIRECKENC